MVRYVEHWPEGKDELAGDTGELGLHSWITPVSRFTVGKNASWGAPQPRLGGRPEHAQGVPTGTVDGAYARVDERQRSSSRWGRDRAPFDRVHGNRRSTGMTR